MELSPELDLLEQLNGGDLALGVVGQLFADPGRFKKVVEIYVRLGAVLLVKKDNDAERVMQPWELRELMSDPTAWTSRIGDEIHYRLRLTDEGARRFAQDSQGFWKWFFSR